MLIENTPNTKKMVFVLLNYGMILHLLPFFRYVYTIYRVLPAIVNRNYFCAIKFELQKENMGAIKKWIFVVGVLFFGYNAFGQGNIEGTVKDSSGKAVEFVSITVQEKNITSLTDSKGYYIIKNVPAGNYTLVSNLVGYSMTSKPVTVKDNSTVKLDFESLNKVYELYGVTVNGVVAITGIGHLSETHDNVIYAGKKTEVMTLDSLNANAAQDNPREVLGRVPGSNYSETEGEGFPSNGIGFRGLNPTQSIETNTRQNGYNITGDIYGYPESYYLPPLEAVERVEVTLGASALEFGPQFGGTINYIIKQAPTDKPFEFTTEETTGSYGLMNLFNSVGGTYKKWSYYAFVEGNHTNGWRPNSDYEQLTGFGRVQYKASDKLKIGLEYSLLRNKIHMPGGLDDAEFNENPDQSFRSRNWLTTPWNVMALTADYKINDNTTLSLKSAYNRSSRSILWRSEDGGPESKDSINPVTLTYDEREVEHEYFRNSTTELRLLSSYNIGGRKQVLGIGVRFYAGSMIRQEGGTGTTGSDFNYTDSANYYGNDLTFTSVNVAAFVENTFHIGNKLSVTPGFRLEYLKSSAKGYVSTDDDSLINVNESKSRYIPLAGLGIQFRTTNATHIYANASQAYTPIEYSYQYPLGYDTLAKIDPNLKDITGYNIDLGWTGSVKDFLNFDVGAFLMRYNNVIAFEYLPTANGTSYYSYETNVADAIHQGVETYVELNVVKMFTHASKIGTLSFFNSFSYDQAKYIDGVYKGNWAEYAPITIERFGVTYQYKTFSTTFLISNTAKQYTDANNTVYDPSALVGIIPAYRVMDWSSTLKIKNYHIKFGINNVADARYFTLRTVEYPGPGIIPAMGRSFYLGFGASF